MYKKGDKVRVRADLEVGKKYNDITLLEGNMAACRGEVGTVMCTDKYGDVFVHIPSVDCRFYFNNEMLEPIQTGGVVKTEKYFNIGDIVSHPAFGIGRVISLNCDSGYNAYTDSYVNKTTYSVEFVSGIEKVEPYFLTKHNIDIVLNDEQAKKLAEQIKERLSDGRINFKNGSEIKKEKKPMKEFGKVEGIRIDKTCNKKVEIVTTYASCPHGHATTVCDKANYDAYTGALVAAAKIAALKSNDAMRLYKLAINMWDDAMTIPDSTVAILKTLADEAFDGGFENAYKKWQRQIKAEEKAQTEKELRCSVCGKKFDTPEDARKHEQWHTDKKEAKKQRYLERCEAKRRMAEAERENRIKAYMDELAKDNK